MTTTIAQHRERLQNGETYFGTWLNSSSTDIARGSAASGFDYVCIDMQHGFARAEHLIPMLDAIRSGGDALAVARVPENRFAEIGMIADAGADAIIVPLVSSPEEAEVAVRAVKYPPEGGLRSWGPSDAMLRGRSLDRESLRPLLFVMIENAEGLAAVEQIVSVPGIDGIYVGPSDLSFGVGSVPGPEEPVTTEAIETALRAAKAAGIIPGIHEGNGTAAHARREQGFQFITTTNDFGALRSAYAGELDAAKGHSA
jgi:4-hydroxy-2-oxoheptanedioate aldolase